MQGQIRVDPRHPIVRHHAQAVRQSFQSPRRRRFPHVEDAMQHKTAQHDGHRRHRHQEKRDREASDFVKDNRPRVFAHPKSPDCRRAKRHARGTDNDDHRHLHGPRRLPDSPRQRQSPKGTHRARCHGKEPEPTTRGQPNDKARAGFPILSWFIFTVKGKHAGSCYYSRHTQTSCVTLQGPFMRRITYRLSACWVHHNPKMMAFNAGQSSGRHTGCGRERCRQSEQSKRDWNDGTMESACSSAKKRGGPDPSVRAASRRAFSF